MEPLSARPRRPRPLRVMVFAVLVAVAFFVFGVGPSLVPGLGRSDCGPRSALGHIRDLRGFWSVNEGGGSESVNASSLIAGFDSGRSGGSSGPRWKTVSVRESTAALAPSGSEGGLRRARPKIVSVDQPMGHPAPCR